MSPVVFYVPTVWGHQPPGVLYSTCAPHNWYKGHSFQMNWIVSNSFAHGLWRSEW